MRISFDSLALFAIPIITILLLIRRIWSKEIRRALFGPTLGALAEDWPKLETLMTSPFIYGLRRGRYPLDLQTLMNFMLVDRPSPVLRDMLAAYEMHLQSFDLGEDNETDAVAQAPCLTEQVLKTGLHASFFAQQAGRHAHSIDYPDLLLALFANPTAEAALHAAGLTRLKIKYFLVHRKALPADPSEETAPDTPDSEQVWVRIHNDDFSPMELVTKILQEAFSCDPEKAKELMTAIHCGDIISLGPFAREEGLTRVERSIRLARAAEAPLMLSLASSPASAPTQSPVTSDNPYAPPNSLLDA